MTPLHNLSTGASLGTTTNNTKYVMYTSYTSKQTIRHDQNERWDKQSPNPRQLLGRLAWVTEMVFDTPYTLNGQNVKPVKY